MWARNEVGTALKFLKGYATLSPLQDETLEDSAERKITTSYVPVGIAVGIVPWNYPIYLASAKIGPALLTGNAFILKASPFTPYTSLKMAELAQRFFPPGVFQALSGDDSLGPMLTSHSNVNMVSFTGTSTV
jgi:acyl-CoA reductase-like NAD-dependent aldehyde dehydrogenase